MNNLPVLVKDKKEVLPDTKTHVNRFYVKSEHSHNLYTVSQSRTGRWWACSCLGWIRYKKCKHLAANQLPPFMKPHEIGMEVK